VSLVFVYGTLKRGGCNHSYLAGQRFVGQTRSVSGFTLYALTGYPGLVCDPLDEQGVRGELWEVDAAALGNLDVLEGLEEGLYRRGPIPLWGEFSGLEVETYYYLRSLAGRRHLGAEWAP